MNIVFAILFAVSELWSTDWVPVAHPRGCFDRSFSPAVANEADCSFLFRVFRHAEGPGVEALVRDDECLAGDRLLVGFGGKAAAEDPAIEAEPWLDANGGRTGTRYRRLYTWAEAGLAAPASDGQGIGFRFDIGVDDVDRGEHHRLYWRRPCGRVTFPAKDDWKEREALSGEETWAGRRRHAAVVNPPVPVEGEILSLDGAWDFMKTQHHQSPKYMPWVFDNVEAGLDNRSGSVRQLQVPGLWEAQGVGEPGKGEMHLNIDRAEKEVSAVHTGCGMYRKLVEVPAEWEGKRIWLKVGGVNSRGWFLVNRQGVGLLQVYGGAWKFDITDLVNCGCTNEFNALIDNAVGARSVQQGNVNRWGGFTRSIELEATPFDCWIDDAWVRGDFDGRKARVEVEVEGGGGQRCGELSLRATVEGESSQIPLSTSTSSPSPFTFTLEVPLRHFRPWSPECPNLHTAKVELVSADGRVLQTRYERFGVRKLEVRGKEFYLNGRPFFFRGFGDDSTYPITGYSPCDREYHRRHLEKAKAAGFNYVRLHTHCELPEYMDICDELGLFVQPELGYYFDNPGDHFDYDPLRDAKDRHLAFRRHPSWGISSGGNEAKLGPAAGSIVYEYLKRTDLDRLVEEQDGPSLIGDDLRKFEDFCGGPLNVWERGSYDPPLPFICHEYLNLSVKQDYRLEGCFSGLWKPVATREWRTEYLAKAGLTHEGWGDLLQNAQHELQKYLQKNGIETARRDPYCDGYCYWTIVDVAVYNAKLGFYTAQGLFDCFWNTKNHGATPEEFAVYNSPRCLLFEPGDGKLPPAGRFTTPGNWFIPGDFTDTNRVFRSGETIRGRLLMANYGEEDVENAEFRWRLVTSEGRVIANGRKTASVPVGPVRELDELAIEVPVLEAPCAAKLEVEGAGIANSWDFYLFPSLSIAAVREQAEKAGIVIADEGSEALEKALAAGRNVIALTNQTGKANFRLGWWWIGSQCGTAVKRHPVLGDFPTGEFLSPLYFRIIKEGAKLAAGGVKEDDLVIAGEGGEGFYRYLSVERRPAGNVKVSVAGLDVTSDTPEGANLLRNIVNYLKKVPRPFPKVGAVKRLTNGPKDHLFANYFAINAWSPGDLRYVAVLETDINGRLPEANERITLGLVDTHDGNRFIPVTTTACWNFQEATMFHWLPQEPDTFVFNDMRDGKAVAVVMNWKTKQERILPRPVSAVSRDGTKAISINYSRLYLTRPDYGYPGNGQDDHRDVEWPENDGLWLMDMKTGESKLILSVAQGRELMLPTEKVEGKPGHPLAYYCHTVLNPDASRVFFLARSVDWFDAETHKIPSWNTTSFTVKTDGTDLRKCFPQGDWGGSHFHWKNNEEMVVTVWPKEVPGRSWHVVFKVGEEEKGHRIAKGLLDWDGHCNYSPDGEWMSTEGYYDQTFLRNWVLMRTSDETCMPIGSFYVPEAYRGGYWRCDLHSRWRPDGRQLGFNSVHEGSRQVYVVDLEF